MEEILESLTSFAKFGNIPPGEYWQMTWTERKEISEKLTEILKEEAKAKAARDTAFLKAIAKIVSGVFGKR